MNRTISKIKKGIKNPSMVRSKIFHSILMALVKDDEKYVKWDYWWGIGKFPNLDNPQTYNEKLCWLKLNARRPEYTKMVDKYDAKEFARNIVGDDYIIPTYGVWDRFEDIDFDALPNEFVLKTTHDSGWVIICKDKSKFDKISARKKVEESYKNNLFWYHREYPYKDLKPRIIIEKLMVEDGEDSLKDYKFFCFDGKVKMLLVATGRTVDTRIDFFDRDFNHLPFKRKYPHALKPIAKPENYDKMIEIAEMLSIGIPHVRADLYNINGQIYFGEMTFFSGGGTVKFEPDEWDYKVGEWLKLPKE